MMRLAAVREARRRNFRAPLLSAGLAVLLVASCGGGGAEGGAADGTSGTGTGGTEGTGTGGTGNTASPSRGVPHETGLVGVTETDAEPVEGGTLSLAVWSETYGLDPKAAPAVGVLGGMEAAAIYDVLVRYDPATGEYEPWMAKSLEHSDDYGTWTLTLREGVAFTDGTPLNAEAVVFNFERAKGDYYNALVSQIASMETPDEHTVVFHLNKPWSRFAWALSVGPGRPASPTAIKKWGDEYGKHPVGAGPFVLERWAPGEEIVMSANENYWGAGPYLDTLRFVPLGGDQARLDALNAGGVQAAFLRNPDVIAATRKAGYGGFVNVMSTSEVLALNNHNGRPGHDLRIRKAIAYAINIDQVNQRVYDGKGLMQKEIIAETSRWATEAEATPYDPEQAKELLRQAKADGFDGSITLSTNDAPARKDTALALQAQLNAVGFETSIEYAPSSTALFTQLLKGNYDLSMYGISVSDAGPWVKLDPVLRSDGPRKRVGYVNPEMDALLDKLHDATTEQGKRQALNEIQQLWTETVPMVSLAAVPEFVAWDDSVHGVTPTLLTTVLFANAWLSD